MLLLTLRYPAQFMLTQASLLLNALASLMNNFIPSALERSLNEQELAYLKPIFGDNLKYDAIKIQTGGVKEKLKIAPQAVGNDIFLREHWGAPVFSADRTLTSLGLRILGHEACHNWQFQQRGAGYIGDSLLTQVFDVIGRRIGMRLSDGYDLYAAIAARRDYRDCNVEQQAVMAEMIGITFVDLRSEEFGCEVFNRASGFNLGAAEFELVEDAHAKLTGMQKI